MNSVLGLSLTSPPGLLIVAVQVVEPVAGGGGQPPLPASGEHAAGLQSWLQSWLQPAVC